MSMTNVLCRNQFVSLNQNTKAVATENSRATEQEGPESMNALKSVKYTVRARDPTTSNEAKKATRCHGLGLLGLLKVSTVETVDFIERESRADVSSLDAYAEQLRRRCKAIRSGRSWTRSSDLDISLSITVGTVCKSVKHMMFGQQRQSCVRGRRGRQHDQWPRSTILCVWQALCWVVARSLCA